MWALHLDLSDERSRSGGTAGDTLRTVTLAIPALIALVGMSVLLARRQPLVPVAVLFFLMGIYTGQTWAGHQVTDGLDQLARWIG